MIHILAQASGSSDSWTMIERLGILASLGVSLIVLARSLSGKDSERQIEPTQIHAITTELGKQTLTLNKLDREVGGISAKVDSIRADTDKMHSQHAREIEGMHSRIGGISREGAATSARVDGLERRERLAGEPR